MDQIAVAIVTAPLPVRLIAGGTLMEMSAHEIALVAAVSRRQVHRHRAHARTLLCEAPQAEISVAPARAILRNTVGDRTFSSIASLMKQVQPELRIVTGGTCLGLSSLQLAGLLYTSPRQVKRWRAECQAYLERGIRTQKLLTRLWVEQGRGRSVCVG